MPHPSSSSAYGIWSLNEVRDAVRGDNWPGLYAAFAFDLDSVGTSTGNFNGLGTNVAGIFFGNVGTEVYTVDRATDYIYQATLTTPYDITTASNTTSLNMASIDTAPTGIWLKEDGLTAYVCGYTNDNVYQFSLSTAWDISSASLLYTKDISADVQAPFGLFFKPDGTEFYIPNNDTDSIHQYSLSSAWDVTSASHTRSVSAGTTVPTGVWFHPLGTRMFIADDVNDRIRQYELSTAWDISTAVFAKFFSDPNSNTGSVAFTPNGQKMFITGRSNGYIYEYPLS